jgi:hypothetical protein
MANATNHGKSLQFMPKPLSIEQRNAISLLITGATDAEVSAAVGVNRTIVWGWRHSHSIFMSELERARAEVYRAAQEKL